MINRKNKIYFIIGVLLLALSTGSYAQNENEAVYQNYYVHPAIMNVGRTGVDGPELIVGYNNSWQGFGVGTRLANAMYHGPVGGNSSLGLQISSDREGSYNNFETQLSYAYKAQFSTSDVSFGLGTGYVRRGLSSKALINNSLDPDDPYINELADGIDLLQVSVGVHAEQGQLYYGLSLPNLFKARIDNEIEIAGNDDETTFNYFMGYVGYDFLFEENNFSLEPSLYIRGGRRAPLQVDLNALMKLKQDQLVGGLSFSMGQQTSSSILLGTTINNLQIYYSYKVAFGDFQRYNNGSHELSFVLDLRKDEIENE